MAIERELAQRVRERAAERCEGATFHIEHVLPTTSGGATDFDNLALACPSCNLHKSDRTQATDPETGALALLFNPRRHRWHDHFQWDAYRLVGTTDIGRATEVALDLNQPRRLKVRQAEAIFGLFPPAIG